MKSEATSLAQKNGAGISTGQELRAVGQGLESLDVEDFDLKAEGDGYFALATRRLPAETRKAGVKKAIRPLGTNFLRAIGETSKSDLTCCACCLPRTGYFDWSAWEKVIEERIRKAFPT
jgi:hypothetical protein